MIEGLLPFLVGEFITIHQVDTFTEIKDGDEGAGDARRTGSRFVCVIVHHHRLTAIAHQPGDIFVGHVEPVEFAGGQRRKVYLGLRLLIFIRRVADSLAHAV